MNINDSSNASLKLRYKESGSFLLDFSFESGEVLSNDCEVRIYFGKDDKNFIATDLKSGMTLEECVRMINQWEFSEFSDRRNPTKGVTGMTSIELTYQGNATDYLISTPRIWMSEISNLIITINNTESYKDWDFTFGSDDISKLGTPSYWLRAGGYTGWTYPNYMFGALEYMKSKHPETKVVMLGIPNYSSTMDIAIFDEDGNLTNNGSKYEDESINPYAVLNSKSAKSGHRSKMSSYMTAKKFKLQFIDLQLLSGITPCNLYSEGYYNYGNVHLTPKGYKQWADCISLYCK